VRLTQRPAQGPDDLRLMQAVADAHLELTVHVVDLPYRLATSALHEDRERDTRLWFHGDQLVGWAVWQRTWVTLDYAVDADHAPSLREEILGWAEARFHEIAAGKDRRLPYWVSAREDDHARIRALEAAGFTRREWVTVRQERPLAEPPPAAGLPPGFTIRPLHGEEEVEAYVAAHRAAFGTENMTVAFRRRVLRMPHYRPDLDLVVEAPDGRIAAFTIIWWSGSLREGQFEPVGTHPDFQRRGLARALLVEGSRRIRDAGGVRAVVEADSVRPVARRLYESVMPVAGYRILHYAKEF
jgi:mycothiol synthase